MVHVRCVLFKYDRKPQQIPLLIYVNTEALVKQASFLLKQLCIHLERRWIFSNNIHTFNIQKPPGYPMINNVPLNIGKSDTIYI